MVIGFRSIPKITFPVFLLDSENWEEYDGILFLDNKVLDDRNQSGETLGARRMQTPHKNLHILKHMVEYPNGLLKQKTKYFIDNSGRPFIYEKTTMLPLKYLKISKVELKDSATLIRVKGHNSPFTVPRPPEVGYTWAGILHVQGLPWMLYEYSETKLKDTRRKV
jgi:hypothetical protein